MTSCVTESGCLPAHHRRISGNYCSFLFTCGPLSNSNGLIIYGWPLAAFDRTVALLLAPSFPVRHSASIISGTILPANIYKHTLR